jgi:nucleotide-binding universal stress UspA family protein
MTVSARPSPLASPSASLRRAAVPANGTIACVIDELPSAEAAIEVARRLAERFDARMLLIGVADGVGGIYEGVSAVHAEAGAKRRLQRLAAQHDVANEELRVATGDPAEAVARIAAEEAVDMIVVGAQRGLRARTLLSILAGDLSATAPCPVVVAPPRYRSATDRNRGALDTQ